MPRIYLDNAATTLHKPPAVAAAINEYMTGTGASAGRGAYREAMHTGRLMRQCRDRFNRLVNGQSALHCIFALNCSDALNLALKGILRPGDHVVSTVMDHNSVLRPLAALGERIGVTTTYVPADPRTTRVDPSDIRAAITPRTTLVAVNHVSNVTGVEQDIAAIGAVCREAGVTYLVDAAQSCGHVPIDVQAMHIDLLAVPGHKGLLGPSGTGLLYLRPGLEERLATVREGGTGSASEHAEQPQGLPDKYEPGSQNALGVIGLNAGLGWILDQTVARIHAHDLALCRQFLDGVAGLEGLTVYGPGGTHDRGPGGGHTPRVGTFSVRLEGYTPHELAAALEAQFNVLTRAGLHCAPWAHRTIGTLDSGGTTRFSFSALTTAEDVSAAVAALHELAGAGVQV